MALTGEILPQSFLAAVAKACCQTLTDELTSSGEECDLGGHVGSAAQSCSRPAMQHGRNYCYDAVVHQFAKNDCCLLKGIGTMQSGALGLVLQQPLPVTQLENQLQKGIRSPLQNNAQSQHTQLTLIQADPLLTFRMQLAWHLPIWSCQHPHV